jgi:hypothetical protein
LSFIAHDYIQQPSFLGTVSFETGFSANTLL